ncbi:MAG: hypothetical protein CVT48_00005 [Thermoplasmata archaeon HGW-Thermoplasmata-1]|nr:MAG: hypothetical protein CVT48_00005 [Thermoplasmata archaeon HGW-Thermoplasmata-1]
MGFHIFSKTLKDMKWALVGWGVAFALYGVMMVAIYPVFLGEGGESGTEGIEGFWETMPDAMKKMFGEFEDMMTPHGFLQMEFLKFLGIALSIFAVTQCAKLLAGEEEERTIDLLMAQPVKRWRIATEKYLAVVGGLLLILLFIGGSMEIAAALTEGFVSDPGDLLLEVLDAAPACMVFGGMAFLGSAISGRRKAAMGIGIMLAGFTWLVNLIAPIVEKFADAQKATIFYYFENNSPMAGTLEPIYYGVAIPLVILLFASALSAYNCCVARLSFSGISFK